MYSTLADFQAAHIPARANDRSHRSKSGFLEDLGVEFIAPSFMLLPECADCGVQMEMRHYEKHHQPVADSGRTDTTMVRTTKPDYGEAGHHGKPQADR